MNSQVHAFWNPNGPPPHHPSSSGVGRGLSDWCLGWFFRSCGHPTGNSRNRQSFVMKEKASGVEPCFLSPDLSVLFWPWAPPHRFLAGQLHSTPFYQLPCLCCILFQPILHTTVGITEQNGSLSVLFPSTSRGPGCPSRSPSPYPT